MSEKTNYVTQTNPIQIKKVYSAIRNPYLPSVSLPGRKIYLNNEATECNRASLLIWKYILQCFIQPPVGVFYVEFWWVVNSFDNFSARDEYFSFSVVLVCCVLDSLRSCIASEQVVPFEYNTFSILPVFTPSFFPGGLWYFFFKSAFIKKKTRKQKQLHQSIFVTILKYILYLNHVGCTSS